MPEAAALLHATLLEVFAEPDPDRRRAAIERVYAEDVVFTDAEGSVTGREALHAKAGEILAGATGLAFAPDGEPQVVGDLARASWTLSPEGGPPVVRGTDVALVADGQITRLWTFLEQGD
jgi:hypothetical protein